MNTVISCTCITDNTDTLHLYFMYLYHHYSGTLHFGCMYLSHEFICIHALIISVFFLFESLLLLHGLLLHDIPLFMSFNYLIQYITVSCPDIDIDIIILLLGHTGNWSKMCERSAARNIVPHVICYLVYESVGATFRVPRLMDRIPPVILYISC